METSVFEIQLSLSGQAASVEVTATTSVDELGQKARETFGLGDDVILKLIYKGKDLYKVIANKEAPAFPDGIAGKKPPKVMVMATSGEKVSEVAAIKSDPTIRGFDNERVVSAEEASVWGSPQHRAYRFVRFEACTRQSFGHRAGTATPHDFAATRLLKQLASDPGVVAVMVERELVVNTLGEMDPIDDRIMQKKQQEGGCLLGYNTNRGLRIDIKLRPDTLEGFLPYDQLAATLIHELSHNWVGEHDALFWTNYGQMRVEYFWQHARLASSGYVVEGKTTAQLAGVAAECKDGMASITRAVLEDLAREMAQHGIPAQAVAPLIVNHCQELTAKSQLAGGQKVGGGSSGGNTSAEGSARELALAAAERRARKEESSRDESHSSGQ